MRQRARHQQGTTRSQQLAQLRRNLAYEQGRVHSGEQYLADLYAEEAKLSARAEDLRNRLADLEVQGPQIRIFGRTIRLKRETRIEIRQLRSQLEKIAMRLGPISTSERPNIHDYMKLKFKQENACRSQAALLQRIAEIESKINDLLAQEDSALRRQEAAAAREARKAARHRANAIMAAQARGEVRSASASLRARLSRDHPCPYCSGPLGTDPEADHIHPVSKGGLPVEENYVFVCRPCNQAKRDLTLNQFVDRMSLDRNAVLRALRALGKDA